MTIDEFSDQFDLQYNNITSNQAPGLNEHEKSVFATKAEKEVVKNYFSSNSKGNTLQQGFDDSAKRQADFSMLLKTSVCTPIDPIQLYCLGTDPTADPIIVNSSAVTLADSEENPVSWEDIPEDTYTVSLSDSNYQITVGDNALTLTGFPITLTGSEEGSIENKTEIGKIDYRSSIYSFPNDTYIIINEAIKTTKNRILQVMPLRYDEYTRFMSKPFKRPVKNQAWRLMNSGIVEDDEIIDDDELVPNPNAGIAHKVAELITNSWDTVKDYSVRYIRTPDPIILADLDEPLSIDGKTKKSKKINIDPILHEDILQRAVELAKIAWTATGQDNAQMVIQAGQRSE